ncbi:MAG: pirin family protein [Flavobacteriales bacterium]|nr:pirin family protein [Flavobacteriales bacterium]
MSNSPVIKIEQLGFPWRTKDPFLFCAHHRDQYPKGNENMGVTQDQLLGRNVGSDFTIKDGFRMYHGSKVPGFPYHPHRGFETITINKEGFVDHSDSLGSSGRFGEGDVQWMTAGRGIQHSEMFPLVHEEKENPLEIFQIWLNLPKVKKFVEPHFRMLWKNMIPIINEVDKNNNSTEITLIAGSYNDAVAPSPTPDSWAAEQENNVNVWTVKMQKNAIWNIPTSDKDYDRTIYFYRGSEITIGPNKIKEYHLIEADSKEKVQILNGSEDAYFLILQGKPINEPVAQHGPFVMNTEQEIHEAFAEYRKTQFGGWPWAEHEVVHPRDAGVFEKHNK